MTKVIEFGELYFEYMNISARFDKFIQKLILKIICASLAETPLTELGFLDPSLIYSGCVET